MAPAGFFSNEISKEIRPINNMNRITQYVKDTRAEMAHVNWPTRQQTVRFTSLVIAVSIVTAAILGVSDFVFSKLLTLLFH